MNSRVLKIAMIVAAGFTLAGLGSSFAPKSKLWEKWQAHDEQSTAQIDHSTWTAWLQTYVRTDDSGLNRVGYGRVTPDDRAALEAYVKQLTDTTVTALPRAAQKALWINLYNAATAQVILDHYPVDSIRDIDISPGLFADGPWDKKLFTVEGAPVSLNDIEHRILRPIWNDNRIHYAVNCASVGCPNLQREAFTPANIEALLDRAAREYINSPRGAKVANNRLTVSKIYEWYTADFGGDEAGVIDHIKRWAASDLQAAIAARRGNIATDYDWALNDDR